MIDPIPSPAKRPAKPKKFFRVAYVISSHGFGHAARAAAIMEALAMQVDIHFDIITTTPRWFFSESLTADFTHHSLETDVGLAQLSSLEIDSRATLEQLARFYPPPPEKISALTRIIKGCDLLLTDIAPLGLIAAKENRIASVLVENFTWDWIYQGYTRQLPGLAPYIDYLQPVYRAADYRIQTEPICKETKSDLRVPPVSRKIRSQATAIRTRLEVPPDKKVILVTMGGIGGDRFALEPLLNRPEEIFVLPGEAEKFTVERNLRLLPKNSGIYHPDLVNAADLVIGKTGYSTLAEVYNAGVPWGHISRDDFPESPYLADFIEQEMQGAPITAREFVSGHWLAKLPSLLQLPRERTMRQNGAEPAARFVAGLLACEV